MPSLADAIRPNLFISYSRVQSTLARVVAHALLSGSNSVWFDRDSITIGSNWIEEIERGIQRADELVTLVSVESLVSRVVELEIQIAESMKRSIRPLVMRGTESNVPDSIKKYHCVTIDLENPEIPTELRIPSLLGQDTQAVFVLRLTRSILPPLAYAVPPLSPGQCAVIIRQIRSINQDFSEFSAVRLNHGLICCGAGDFLTGLETLRQYAQSTDNPVGWYMLALHLNQGRSFLSISRPEVIEAFEAVERAANQMSNPLIEILRLVILVAGLNHGQPTMIAGADRIKNSLNEAPEHPNEYRRLFASIRMSLPALRDFAGPLSSLIKECARG